MIGAPALIPNVMDCAATVITLATLKKTARKTILQRVFNSHRCKSDGCCIRSIAKTCVQQVKTIARAERGPAFYTECHARTDRRPLVSLFNKTGESAWPFLKARFLTSCWLLYPPTLLVDWLPVISGIRTMCGVSMIMISVLYRLFCSCENRYFKRGTLLSPGQLCVPEISLSRMPTNRISCGYVVASPPTPLRKTVAPAKNRF